MIICTELAIISRMALGESPASAYWTRVSSRPMHSLGLLEWTVVREPSCPVPMAWSMSRVSPPRHSPTTMRSGRIRRVCLTRQRMSISPSPSREGGLVSSRTTCSWGKSSSAESSQVMIRSLAWMKPPRMLMSVVFPEPVPPETTMFRWLSTAILRKSAMFWVQESNAIRSL